MPLRVNIILHTYSVIHRGNVTRLCRLWSIVNDSKTNTNNTRVHVSEPKKTKRVYYVVVEIYPNTYYIEDQLDSGYAIWSRVWSVPSLTSWSRSTIVCYAMIYSHLFFILVTCDGLNSFLPKLTHLFDYYDYSNIRYVF